MQEVQRERWILPIWVALFKKYAPYNLSAEYII